LKRRTTSKVHINVGKLPVCCFIANTTILNVTVILEKTLPEGTNLTVRTTYSEIAKQVEQTVSWTIRSLFLL